MMTHVRFIVEKLSRTTLVFGSVYPCSLGLPPVDQRVSVEFVLQSGRMKFNIEAYVTVGVYRICMR